MRGRAPTQEVVYAHQLKEGDRLRDRRTLTKVDVGDRWVWYWVGDDMLVSPKHSLVTRLLP